MKKLEDYTRLTKLFTNGITPNWEYALKHGLTKLYNNDTLILNYYIEEGVCVVNSGSIDNATFPKSILRDIKHLIETNENIIISSSVTSMQKRLARYGLEYNEGNRCYFRNVIFK